MDIFEKLKALSAPAPTGTMEYIIIGLGNVGTQYEGTRHNAGFMVIDNLARKYNIDVKKMKFKSLCGDAMISGKRCLLMKPSTFMNNSGEALVEAMNFYKIPIENVIVIYDDISLQPSKLRIRKKGSDGGHNGIKSIIYLTGKDTFPRIKIGVGAKPNPSYNLADWVLSTFKREEYEDLKIALENAVSCIELMVQGKTDDAMNSYNS
ncbi:MAG TPA: aminoacyl-tRNA hydrolase [Oscillospiraceae bacterium]|nr:aminoacyl-tRNA hydrolase [Oscillospiraceae bacterium]